VTLVRFGGTSGNRQSSRYSSDHAIVVLRVHRADLHQLAQAREDALLLSGPLTLVGRVLEGLLAEDTGGTGSLSALEPNSTSTRAGLARSVLILCPLAGDAARRDLSSRGELVGLTALENKNSTTSANAGAGEWDSGRARRAVRRE
jgi:hypothetical protein